MDLESRNCTVRAAKTKALISFAVTAKLFCAFVFEYAKCWLSHECFLCILLGFWFCLGYRLSQHMSHPMGKPTICICENKDADQLRGNREADQRLCFRYSDSTIPLLLIRNFKILTIFCACTGRFVSDLFENHIVGFPTRRLNYFM